MKESRLTDGLAALATKMRSENISWQVIARYLGVSTDRLRYRLDPEYHEYRRAKMLADYHAGKNANCVPDAMPKPPLLYRDRLLDKLRTGVR